MGVLCNYIGVLCNYMGVLCNYMGVLCNVFPPLQICFNSYSEINRKVIFLHGSIFINTVILASVSCDQCPVKDII
jgi:hypothetical protein